MNSGIFLVFRYAFTERVLKRETVKTKNTERRLLIFFDASSKSALLFVPARTILPDLKMSAVHFGLRIRTIRAPKRYI